MSCSEGPDCGHAWVVACAACVISMILSGISKMVGLLYVAVIDTYGVSRQQATLPFTIRKSMRCLSGPIVGIIGQRYGVRAVTIAGAFGASLGAFLAFFAPNITWLAVCWGGVHGLGEGFANSLFQVVVNQYFEKYRSTASGIALSGTCMGSIMFTFIVEALRDAYGLQGTFLVLSAIILHVLPAAILLRSPSWIRNGTPKPNTERTKLSQSFKKQPPLYVITNDDRKSNSEKRRGNATLNPQLLEKNEIMKPALTSALKSEDGKNEKSFASSIKTILRLCTNPIYLLVCVCMAIYVFTYIPIMTTMVDYSKDKGLPETVGKYLIQIMAVGDLIGRLCFGWVTDKEYISIPRYMTLTLMLQGIFTILLPLTPNLGSFLALLAFFSMATGSMLIRMPVIVLNHVKKEEHSIAMGCYAFAAGLVPLGVPSLIGHFRDNSGSYDGMYHLLGILSIVSGVSWLFEPLLAKMNKRIEEKRIRRENEI